jgi:hypothetical protein
METLPIGNNPNSPQGENKGLQPHRLNKKEKLAQSLSKCRSHHDENQTNAVVMEKTIENTAERAGISKEEMFDKIDLKKQE